MLKQTSPCCCSTYILFHQLRGWAGDVSEFWFACSLIVSSAFQLPVAWMHMFFKNACIIHFGFFQQFLSKREACKMGENYSVLLIFSIYWEEKIVHIFPVLHTALESFPFFQKLRCFFKTRSVQPWQIIVQKPWAYSDDEILTSLLNSSVISAWFPRHWRA